MSFPLSRWALEVPSEAPARWAQLGLGPRLAALAEAIPEGVACADIGTDHALLPEALLRAHRVSRALACDRAEAPLASARARLEPFRDAPWFERLELRLGDGFAPLEPGEVTVAILAGFGGPKMRELLEAISPERIGLERLVLQPTAGLPALRAWLWARGWTLEESAVREGRRGFITTVATRGGRARTVTPLEALVGALPPEDPLLRAWLEAQSGHLRRQGARAAALLRSVEAHLDNGPRPE